MRLPHREDAIISPDKLRGYLLSKGHPVGRFKAAFFGRLGYTEDDWIRLELDLRRQHLSSEAEELEPTGYGRKFLIRAPLLGPSGVAAVTVSLWFIRTGEEVPRFLTAYPGGHS